MFEKKNEPLASPREFRWRTVRFLLIALGVTVFWVGVGSIGFYYIANLPWEDALYNAAMVASEMGPVFIMTTTPAKFFASCYALLSGLVFITSIGIAFAPIIHRLFHYFHLEDTPD
jgi:hypothetical protein